MQSKQPEVPQGLTWKEKVEELQQIPERIRNICILAHVDHGKTSLSDSLISSNSIINPKLAGTLRYLDSREDEQQRMITMKASSIALLYSHSTPISVIILSFNDHIQQKQQQQLQSKSDKPLPQQYEEKQYLINLMDSPGHVDFSSEVSSALRLSDGAIVLVDVLEGVSSQTHTVLKQAFEEKVKTCLVLNKIDKLIIDRQMEAQEIYQHLNQIIEQVNSIVAELISKEYLSASQQISTQQDIDQAILLDDDILEQKENELFFCPEKGNVAFSSALDCWAFNLTIFARKIAQKFGMNPRVLQQFLWGDFYYSDKKIFKKPQYSNSREMFVQFVMEPLVAEYRKAFSGDMTSTTEYKEARTKIKNLFSKWMPMEKGIMGMIVQHIPSPLKAQKEKISSICQVLAQERNEQEHDEIEQIRQAIIECKNKETDPTIAYVTKMQPFSSRLYDIVTKSMEKSPSSTRQIAFSRVFSGCLKRGQTVYAIGPRHGINGQEDIKEVKIDHLFLLMGSSLQLLEEASAGCIVGIADLEDVILKTGVISSSPKCPNFQKTKIISQGLVKVAIESDNLSDMERLKQGLIKLDRADPSVNFYINAQGEYILSTCGEVHLDRCIKDLNDDFAKGVKLVVSEPIITFKETIVNMKLTDKKKKVKGAWEEVETSSEEEEEEKKQEDKKEEEKTLADIIAEYEQMYQQEEKEREFLKKEMKTDMYIEKILFTKYYQNNQKALDDIGFEKQCAKGKTGNQKCSIKVRAVALNFLVTKWLESQHKQLHIAYNVLSNVQEGIKPKLEDIETAFQFCKEFKSILEQHKTNKRLIRIIEEKTLIFGPKKKGPNILINQYMKKEDSFFHKIYQLAFEYLGEKLEEQTDLQAKIDRRDKQDLDKIEILQEIANFHQISIRDMSNAFINGFELATNAGPLCEEPMLGAIFIIESIELIKQPKIDDQEEEVKGASEEKQAADTYGPFNGQVIHTVRNLCKRAFLNSDPRIVEGMYLCSLHATTDTYGKIYGVMNKCRGRVVSEEVQEGTNNILIDVLIPIAESFVFNEEIRVKSCGIAYPQLVFHGFEILQDDPFYIPLTKEELEDHGEGDILPPNPAKVIIENVRKRKGLQIDRKIVGAADKQRNLSKKK